MFCECIPRVILTRARACVDSMTKCPIGFTISDLTEFSAPVHVDTTVSKSLICSYIVLRAPEPQVSNLRCLLKYRIKTFTLGTTLDLKSRGFIFPGQECKLHMGKQKTSGPTDLSLLRGNKSWGWTGTRDLIKWVISSKCQHDWHSEFQLRQ